MIIGYWGMAGGFGEAGLAFAKRRPEALASVKRFSRRARSSPRNATAIKTVFGVAIGQQLLVALPTGDGCTPINSEYTHGRHILATHP